MEPYTHILWLASLDRAAKIKQEVLKQVSFSFEKKEVQTAYFRVCACVMINHITRLKIAVQLAHLSKRILILVHIISKV